MDWKINKTLEPVSARLRSNPRKRRRLKHKYPEDSEPSDDELRVFSEPTSKRNQKGKKYITMMIF